MVSQIITYLPSANTIFAIGSEGQSLLKSTDMGHSWVGVNKRFYTRLVAGTKDAINATIVPWLTIPSQFANTIQGAQCTAYKAGSWYSE